MFAVVLGDIEILHIDYCELNIADMSIYYILRIHPIVFPNRRGAECNIHPYSTLSRVTEWAVLIGHFGFMYREKAVDRVSASFHHQGIAHCLKSSARAEVSCLRL